MSAGDFLFSVNAGFLRKWEIFACFIYIREQKKASSHPQKKRHSSTGGKPVARQSRVFQFYWKICLCEAYGRSGLPSWKDCYKPSAPEQSVARRCISNWTSAWELGTLLTSGESERKFTESSRHLRGGQAAYISCLIFRSLFDSWTKAISNTFWQ